MAHLLFAHDLPCRPVTVGWRWGAQETSDGGLVRGATPRIRVRASEYFRGGTQVRRAPTHGTRRHREFDPDAAAGQSTAAADDRAGGRIHRRDSESRSAGAAQAAPYGASHLGAAWAKAVGLPERRIDGAAVCGGAEKEAGACRGGRGPRCHAV